MEPRPREEMSLSDVVRRFLNMRSARLIAAKLLLLVGVRAGLGSFTFVDAIIFPSVVVFWSFQEWFLHKHLLHAKPRQVLGMTIDPDFARKHREHHRRPWDLDFIGLPTRVLAVTMPLNVLAWWALMPTLPQAVTGMAAFTAMALLYEWTHFLTHTTYRPRSRFYAELCQAHRRHHFKNEHYWYGFTLPLVDKLLRTAPDHRSVPTSQTCRTLGVDEP